MSKIQVVCSLSCLISVSLLLTACGSSHTSTPPNVQISVVNAGTGTGSVSSSPAGISCGQTCSGSFTAGTSVTLTATPSTGSTFAGWSGGGCSGTGTCSIMVSAAASVTATFNTAASSGPQLTVALAGTGGGSVSSSPAGITCGSTCTANFASGTAVTLTATANTGSNFGGWSGGGCSGTSTCVVTLSSNTSVTATFNTATGINQLNHIVFLAQENRSFDQYFGALRQYWAQNGYPDQSFDGLAQFNPTTGAAPLQGPAPTNPGCNPNNPPPSDCVYDPTNPVPSFHLKTVCNENTSPSWDEAHVDWNYNDQVDQYGTPTLDGFVFSAAHDFRALGFYDVNGNTPMGYFDGNDMNYYYFMASNFATSDRWFHPAMTRTHPNREYLIAATSQGRVYPNGTNSNDSSLLTATTIFQELQAAGITWKIYVDPATVAQGGCAGPPYDPNCLLTLSYVKYFAFGQTIPTQYPQNIAPISQYTTDAQNGTLPQVALIEPATDAGDDEHGSNSDQVLTNVQLGASYVSGLINTLMQSPSWKDSAFILTFDEFGGTFDHVAPIPAVSPDGIKPVDLQPNDVCNNGATGATCDFVFTGYRVPLIVVSPFAKKNYVSHTATDYTAILKLIETRFNVPALTKRDAAQIDMTEFFDFNNPPWVTPPSPPAQNTSGACSVNPPPTP